MRTFKPPVLALLLISVLAFAAAARADWNGSAAWNMSPFIDNICVDYSVGPSGQVQLVGKVVACGLYHLPVTGAISGNAPGSFRLGLHATLEPGTCLDPAEPTDGAINATITAPGFGGPFQLQCGTFTNAGDLVLLPACPPCVASVSGPAALR